MRYVFALPLLLLFVEGNALAQWGGGRCGPVGPPCFSQQRYGPPIYYAPRYEDRSDERSEEADDAGACTMAECPKCHYRFKVCGDPLPETVRCKKCGNRFPLKEQKDESAEARKPAACACDCGCKDCHCGKKPKEEGGAQALAEKEGCLFGVQAEKVRPNGGAGTIEHCGPNGCHVVDRGRAIEILEKGGDAARIPDDAQSMRVTAIGTKEETAPVAADSKAGKLGPVVFQAYTYADWAVNDALPKELREHPGHPAIFVQAAPDKPGGEAAVLWRQDSYQGADQLVGEIRKVDPQYDPSKDSRPGAPGDLDPATIGGVALAGLAGIFYLRRRTR